MLSSFTSWWNVEKTFDKFQNLLDLVQRLLNEFEKLMDEFKVSTELDKSHFQSRQKLTNCT